jgi:hypothetical protein
MQLTARDRTIIQMVHRHRFLRSSHIASLMGDTSQHLLRRLQLLYHHGFLERPRCQIDYYHHGGSRHMVYGIGSKGAALLKRELGLSVHPFRWSERNRSVGRIYLEHALLVSDVMVAIELACRESGHIRLLGAEELSLPGQTDGQAQPFRWSVNVSSEVRLGVVPDRVFAMEYMNRAGSWDRAFFFLEADRGTMPVRRRNLSQTSFYRKLLAYEATWSQSIHRTRFGFHRFRVLTVTTSAERLRSLVEICSQLKGGHGLFLFADWTSVKRPSDIFSPIWRSGRQGGSTGLLD